MWNMDGRDGWQVVGTILIEGHRFLVFWSLEGLSWSILSACNVFVEDSFKGKQSLLCCHTVSHTLYTLSLVLDVFGSSALPSWALWHL